MGFVYRHLGLVIRNIDLMKRLKLKQRIAK